MRTNQKFLAIAALAIFTVCVAAQTDAFEFAGGAKLTRRSIEEENKARVFEISANYPELRGIYPAIDAKFNQSVETAVMQDVDRFRKSMLEMDDEELKFARERGFSNYMEIGYSVALANRDVISISFGNSNFTGGAHPNSHSFTINFDLKNGRELRLADLFLPGSDYLKTISDYAVADLNRQLETQDDEWVARGAGPAEENFKNWTLADDGLHIEFDSYQVAPYVVGPQEVVIPYARLRSVLRVFDFEPLRYADDGNPVNWCRNGLFPQDGDDFRLARITGSRNEKVYFYNDDKEDCPDGAGCKTRSYVIPGDEVIVSKTYGSHACSWYQPKKGSETVGWIEIDKLSFDAAGRGPASDDWIGDWDSYDNSITIVKGKKAGSLKITGIAIWKGLGDNVHVGELDHSAVPAGAKMSFGDDGEYDCRVKMQRIGRFLIVADNLNCGGMNVTFNGVYRRK